MKIQSVSLLLIAVFLNACGNNDQVSQGTNTNHEFLPVNEAFQFSSKQLDDSTVQLSWKIAEGYHLYKDKIEFQLEPQSARIADVKMPSGVMLDDKTFGRQETYKDHVNVAVTLKQQPDLKQVKLVTQYQGCSEKGLCYPPETREVNISL